VSTFSPEISPPARKRRPSQPSALLRLTLGTRLSGAGRTLRAGWAGQAEQAARGSAGRPSSEASLLFLFFFILQIYI